MGFLFQNTALFDFLTLHDNLALPLRRASPIIGLDNQSEIHTDGSSGDPYGPTYYPIAVNRVAAVPVAVVGASGNTAPS